MTIKKILKNVLPGIDQLDAEILLAHVLGKTREFVIAHPETTLSNIAAWRFFRLVRKRKKYVPLAHLTGHKSFFGLDFLVTKRTLVPRPETEQMVELAITKIKEQGAKNNTPITLIDVGTGTGCIPISILNKTTGYGLRIKSYATDISKKALTVAKKNAQKHDVDITFCHGNLLMPVAQTLKHANTETLIVTANLPYLTEKQALEEPSIQHEPKIALVAAEDGLALYRALFEQIKNADLSADMTIFCEIDPDQTQRMKALAEKLLPKAKLSVHKDLCGHDRIVKIALS